MNQWWIIVNWPLRNKLQWNVNRNSNSFIKENTSENVVCEMLSISSWPRCVNQYTMICIEKKCIICKYQPFFTGPSTVLLIRRPYSKWQMADIMAFWELVMLWMVGVFAKRAFKLAGACNYWWMILLAKSHCIYGRDDDMCKWCILHSIWSLMGNKHG